MQDLQQKDPERDPRGQGAIPPPMTDLGADLPDTLGITV
jgi:hypothetical protein